MSTSGGETGPCAGGGGNNSPISGGVVARLSPQPGDNCEGSTSELGENLPASSSSPSTQINDIYALWAKNQMGYQQPVGWLYFTPTSVWVESNVGFQDFWTNIGKAIPAVGAFGNAFDNGDSFGLLSSSLGSELTTYVDGHGGFGASCFKNPLGPVD